MRILLCAAAGWLTGEVVSRTLLARETSRSVRVRGEGNQPSKRPAESPAETAAREWREFLEQQQMTAPRSMTLAELKVMAETLDGSAGSEIVLEGPDVRLNFARQLMLAAPEDFPRLLELVIQVSDARVQRQVAGAFFAAWAEHDPRAALSAAKRKPILSMAALNGVLKVWAEKDARGMIEWLKSPDTFGWAKMQAETNAFVYLVESDPQQAMQLAAEFRASGRLEAMNTVFKNWHRRDSEAAERWMDTAPEADRRDLFPSLISARTGQDPAAAWELALTQHPDPGSLPNQLPAVFAAWLKKDAVAARAALLNVPAEIWNPAFSSVTGSMLGQRQAPDLETTAARIPGPARASFWAGVADGSIGEGRDPAAAAAAFSHLPADDDERLDLADRITKEWLRRDNAEAASKWVSSLPQGLARDMGSAALAEGLVLTDPEAAGAWAADIQNEKMRTDVMKRMGR